MMVIIFSGLSSLIADGHEAETLALEGGGKPGTGGEVAAALIENVCEAGGKLYMLFRRGCL